VDEAAHKLGRPLEEISKWETGELRPTIPQARKASEVYRRPLAVFYLPEPPHDFETLRDFRTLPEGFSREYSHELSLLVRTTLYRQAWLKEFVIQEQGEPLGFIGSATIRSAPDDVAAQIRAVMGIKPEDQMRCQNRYEALSLWIEKTEEAGVYVFRRGNIDLREARGFVIADEHAPFIFLNSEDAQPAQMFTLAHELCHLWINEPGISNLEPLSKAQLDSNLEIEVFCNQVAASTILAPIMFERLWKNQQSDLPLEGRIERLSSAFKVSEEAIARRLLEKEIITKARYEELRKLYQERWLKFREEKRRQLAAMEKGPSYYVRKLFNNGYAFTQTVISAYRNGMVSGRDASSLLEVKINHLGELAARGGYPPVAGGGSG
jgi:Zn-dependent peptidase ImmA (M78 family)